MAPGSYDFRIGYLNIRGINKHSKRISTLNWITSENFDVIFLQESFSSKADENLWQSEWGDPIVLSHGSKHTCGVSILDRKGFDLDPVQVVADESGRYIILNSHQHGYKHSHISTTRVNFDPVYIFCQIKSKCVQHPHSCYLFVFLHNFHHI